MTGQEAGDRLARLLLPYRVRDHDDAEAPHHEAGWWFSDAPPEVIREAFTLVQMLTRGPIAAAVLAGSRLTRA